VFRIVSHLKTTIGGPDSWQVTCSKSFVELSHDLAKSVQADASLATLSEEAYSTASTRQSAES
jgi:hypothetical protein